MLPTGSPDGQSGGDKSEELVGTHSLKGTCKFGSRVTQRLQAASEPSRSSQP